MPSGGGKRGVFVTLEGGEHAGKSTQHEALLPGTASAGKLGIEPPILLDRPAGKQLQPGYFNPARAARLGEEAGQRRLIGQMVRSRQRRGRHQPR